MKISLVLLTWNERAGCAHDVPRLPVESFHEVFAIDGGSTDGTCEYLSAAGIPVYPQRVKGYNGAYLEAFDRCTGDGLVIFHPKGSIDPATTLDFLPLFERGYDLIVATRMGRGSRNEEDEHLFRPRKWFVRGLGLAASVRWGGGLPQIWDVLHGFRGIRRTAFPQLRPNRAGLTADLEMVIRAYQAGLRCAEVPVCERPRLSGSTHFPAFRTGRKLLTFLASEWVRPSSAARPTGLGAHSSDQNPGGADSDAHSPTGMAALAEPEGAHVVLEGNGRGAVLRPAPVVHATVTVEPELQVGEALQS